jgi:hypothetical protein
MKMDFGAHPKKKVGMVRKVKKSRETTFPKKEVELRTREWETLEIETRAEGPKFYQFPSKKNVTGTWCSLVSIFGIFLSTTPDLLNQAVDFTKTLKEKSSELLGVNPLFRFQKRWRQSRGRVFLQRKKKVQKNKYGVQVPQFFSFIYLAFIHLGFMPCGFCLACCKLSFLSRSSLKPLSLVVLFRKKQKMYRNSKGLRSPQTTVFSSLVFRRCRSRYRSGVKVWKKQETPENSGGCAADKARRSPD